MKIFLRNGNLWWNVNEIDGHSFEEIDKSIENIAKKNPI